VRPNTQQLAEHLAQHPKLALAVQKILGVGERTRKLARDLASALGISEEAAYEKLIELQKGAPARTSPI
jgi:hypothetical protein